MKAPEVMRQPVKQTISIVVPCYCEAGNIEQFYTTLTETIDNEADYGRSFYRRWKP